MKSKTQLGAVIRSALNWSDKIQRSYSIVCREHVSCEPVQALKRIAKVGQEEKRD